MSGNSTSGTAGPDSEPNATKPSVLALDSDTFSLAAPVAAQDRAFVGQHIYAEQTRLLYRFSLVGYLAELIVTFLLGAILWDSLGKRPELFAWFAAAIVVMLLRYGNYKLFIKRNPRPVDLPSWERRFIIGSVLIAARYPPSIHASRHRFRYVEQFARHLARRTTNAGAA